MFAPNKFEAYCSGASANINCIGVLLVMGPPTPLRASSLRAWLDAAPPCLSQVLPCQVMYCCARTMASGRSMTSIKGPTGSTWSGACACPPAWSTAMASSTWASCRLILVLLDVYFVTGEVATTSSMQQRHEASSPCLLV